MIEILSHTKMYLTLNLTYVLEWEKSTKEVQSISATIQQCKMRKSQNEENALEISSNSFSAPIIKDSTPTRDV